MAMSVHCIMLYTVSWPVAIPAMYLGQTWVPVKHHTFGSPYLIKSLLFLVQPINQLSMPLEGLPNIPDVALDSLLKDTSMSSWAMRSGKDCHY